MRSVIVVVATVAFIAASQGPIFALSRDYDSGLIEDISENYIYVRGNRGLHVFEPLGYCSWCEVGLEVEVRFEGPVRATIKPYEETIGGRPVKALIIRDGREDQ